MSLLAIDPGIRGAGAAIFHADGTLAAAAYVKNPMKKGCQVAECMALAREVGEWVIRYQTVVGEVTKAVFEWPRAYQPHKQSGDQNDLLHLPAVDVGIAAMLGAHVELVSVFPDVWKGGQVDKEMMAPRIWARLSPVEQARVERTPREGGLHLPGVEGGIRHDTLDSVGIGLWAFGRLKRQRVFA
jgi:hypothetical protein